MSFEKPSSSKSDINENERLLDRLQKVKGRLEDQSVEKKEEIASINKKIKQIQAELQSDAEEEEPEMTDKEYRERSKESEEVKSPDDTDTLSTEEAPADVRERAKTVRRVLGRKIDEETAKKLWNDLSTEEQERLKNESSESGPDEYSAEEQPDRAFVDINKEEILSSLSKKEKQLVTEYEILYQRLNQRAKSEHGLVLRDYLAENDEITYQEAIKVKKIVERLKNQYS